MSSSRYIQIPSTYHCLFAVFGFYNRIFSICGLCLLTTVLQLQISIIKADCWYTNRYYPEGLEVPTTETCLNCTCTRGSLLCYLRVCPKLPDPPPIGCILLHRYRSCCPELICTDYLDSNHLESRSEPDQILLETACIVNGTIYASGSAMGTSRLCEYCYCLNGKEVCVRPKCLLNIKDCTPNFGGTNCCPIHYNCTRTEHDMMIISSTTTTTIQTPTLGTNCVVDSKLYPEGTKILDIGHSICDNCYCLKGLIQCEPLSCAPPLNGCQPVVRSGQCCASSYNCSGTIETEPEPNYGEYPEMSKDYAKLTKQVPPTIVTELDNTNDFFEDTLFAFVDSLLDGRLTRTIDSTTTDQETDTTTIQYPVTVQSIENSTDCFEGTESTTTITTILPSIDRNEEEQSSTTNNELDYEDSSLPPSLPNVRIIPFVAADALLERSDTNEEHLFSPPQKTEGGFVPKTTTTIPDQEQKVPISCFTLLYGEIVHGQNVPQTKSCNICTCYYGNIVCQKDSSDCPDKTTNTIITNEEIVKSATTLAPFETIWQLLYDSTKKTPTTVTVTNRQQTNGNLMGYLKLAGCNIYGRMYRVGRIIMELSNSCLECKCTEIGVQCRDLIC